MSIHTRSGAVSDRVPLRDLVARVDLCSLVERYTAPGRASGSTVTYHCPHPAHTDYSPSFTVSTSRDGRQRARCWSQCEWSGDALELVKWLEGCDTSEAVRRLREITGQSDTSSPAPRPAPRKPRAATAPVLDTAQRPSSERAEPFLSRYLAHRRWPASVVERFGLEVVLDSFGALRVRHPFTAPTASGEWRALYWQDRGAGASRVKWLSPSGAVPILYNLRALEREPLEGVVICEGPADTITAELALEGCALVACVGVPGVSAWRPEWAQLFAGLRVAVAADSDPAGRRLEEAVRDSLGRSVALVRPKAGDLTDTALELGLEAVRDLLLTALSTQPEAAPLEERDPLEVRLLELFPGARLISGGAA
jgi:DNA primase